MKKILLIVFLLSTIISISQEKTFKIEEIEIDSLLKGTLYTPEKVTKKTKLVILIAGSGPTNRNGNQIGMANNSYKFLAEGLVNNGIAVFSFDKRVIALTIAKKVNEESMRFDDLTYDASKIFNYFKLQKKYKKIIIAGHSEGSLVGMVTSKLNKVDGFISIAGAGRPFDEVLNEQIEKKYPIIKNETKENLILLKEGKTFEQKSTNSILKGLFRESVQPYLISWIKYNPQEEIKKLSIPILLINGTKDIQVPPSDAELLKKACPKAELKLIENMNHVLKSITKDEDNLKSYNNPDLPIMPEIINCISNFVTKI